MNFCKIERNLYIDALYSFFIRECDKNFIFNGESHDFYEVVCILHGTVSITAGGDIYTLSAGSAIVHPPMEFHAIRAAEGTEPVIVVFSFTAQNFPTLKKNTFLFTKEDEALLTDAYQASKKAFSVEVFHLQLNNGRALEAQRVAETLTLFLLRLLTERAEFTPQHKPTAVHSYTIITNYISQNLPYITCADQISKACGLSVIGIQKLFHKYAGVGVMHYVNHMKISRATVLLSQGQSNKEVAHALGFSNQNYFSTVFKRITGISPSKYNKGDPR